MIDLLRAKNDEVAAKLAAHGIQESPSSDDVEEEDMDMFGGDAWLYPQSGIEIQFDGDAVGTVFLHGPGNEEFAPFPGALPRGATWTMSFDEALAAMGEPTRRAGRNAGVWVRYDSEEGAAHFKFAPDGSRLVMVTLMTPENAP